MDLDLKRDDVLRNLIPGLVFIVVCISYPIYLAKMGFCEYPKFKSLSPFFAVVVAYPLGFLIHTTYRTIFHTGARLCDNYKFCEQEFIERNDVKLIPSQVKAILLGKLGVPVKDEYEVNKVISQFLSMSLSGEKHRDFKERLDFIMSFMHAIGATLWSIVLAVCIMVFSRVVYLFLQEGVFPDEVFSIKFIWVIFWIIVCCVLFCGRQKIKRSQFYSMRVFVMSRAFSDYVNAY